MVAHHSRSRLELLLAAAGAEPLSGAQLNKTDFVLMHLKHVNEGHPRPLEVLGRFIADFMDAQPIPRYRPVWGTGPAPEADEAEFRAPRETIRDALTREGLAYEPGGRILRWGTTAAPRTLAVLLRARDIPAVMEEFERAASSIDADPPAALTAACALLESICKTILEEDGVPLPRDQSVLSLWRALARYLSVHPESIPADHELVQDLRTILQGLATTVEGIGALRTHAGSAHGRSGASAAPRLKLAVTARHARLAVNAASTLAEFVLSTWACRRKET